MSELHYDVMLSGELLDGFNINEVIQNLARLLTLTENAVSELFQQKHAIVLNGVGYEQAQLQQEKLQSAGAESYLIRHVRKEPRLSAMEQATKSDGLAPTQNAEKTAEIQPRQRAFFFSGQGAEYFRIWIVNIVLTIMTLGIYSAWAKVRNKQYFYANTQLDGASFNYQAVPLQILKGRLIAFAFFVVYIVATSLFPATGAIFGLLFIVLFPWLVVKSLAFNAFYSEYRNVRFGFDGQYSEAFKVYILWPILGLVTFSLLMPYAIYKQQCFLVRNMRYGDTAFEFEPQVSAYYKIALAMIGIVLLTSFGVFLLATLLNREAVGILSIVLTVMMYLTLFAFFTVKTTNLRFNHATLSSHAFSANYTTPSYMWLVLSNTVAIVLTLGLFIPWAKVRVASYKAVHTKMLVEGDLNQFSSAVSQRVGPLGEGVSDVFDMDVGF
ncbi:YjgN family protein [uncultured Methylophaga sp.]|uniref:YjgN family protein n=1 Tax=uncultured Methylophaga sp. TaxID=285271 RepID=UPI0030DB580D